MTDDAPRLPLLELDKLSLAFGGLKALTELELQSTSARSSA